MQLFITDFEQTGNQIIIKNLEILKQMRKVLRMKIEDIFFVQNTNTEDKPTIRYKCQISKWDNLQIIADTLDTSHLPQKSSNKYSIATAMPNKRSKAELIVQKLSELGINKIYFWPSERSVIKQTNDKKLDRLYKIAKEATEQSRGRYVPHIEFIKDISKLTNDEKTKTIIFDKSNNNQQKNNTSNNKKINNILGVIGPEGGLTNKDYQKFGKNYTVEQLGDTILRTETASIIAGREIKKLD